MLKFRILKKKLFFYFVLFILLILFFEGILTIGGYFYFTRESYFNDLQIEENNFSILFLGESTTLGAQLSREELPYPAQVEESLKAIYPDKKIKIYNRGIGGISSTLILRNLKHDLDRYKPDLVIIMVGYNDQFNYNESKTLRWGSKLKFYRFIIFLKNIFDCRFDSNLEKKEGLLWALAHTKPVRKPVSKVLFNFNTIIQTVHSYNSGIWLAGYLQPDAREEVNPFLENLAEENDITYVGDYPLVDFKVNHSLFTSDGWHPSQEGHKIIAENIVRVIVQEGIVDNLVV